MNVNYYTPTLTLFDDKGYFDIKSNEKYIDGLIENGIKGFVVLGSTSEFYAMNLKEKKQIIDFYTKFVGDRAELIIGTGGMMLDETIELSNYAEKSGANAVIIMGPYFHQLSQEAIKYYYETVANNINIDIYLYNFPGKTGYNIDVDTTLYLVENNKNIIGYKDSSRGIVHTKKLIKKVKEIFPDFKIFSGWDDNFLYNVISGGDGCMGALSNIFPLQCSDWAKSFNNNDFEKVVNTQRFIDKAMEMYEITDLFMITFKNYLKIKGYATSVYCKEPQIDVNLNENSRDINKILESILD